MKIQGSCGVVTGAASGIGEAVSTALAGRVVKGLALVDRSDRVVEVAESIRKQYTNTQLIPFNGDVCDAGFRQDVFEQSEKQIGKVRLCVPAAGLTRDRLAVKINKETGK